MADQVEPATTVTLVFPPQPRLVRMARLASSALAAVGGADVDTIDDIKIAVDEVCASLIEGGDGSDLRVNFALDGTRFEISGETTGSQEVDADRFALSRQILRAVADHHELTTTPDGSLRFTVTCSLPASANGA